MAHCPECGATVGAAADVEFTDLASDLNVLSLESPKRFYAAACADCGHTFGTGVAGSGND
jgi:predicted nucleic-acid-binding Zn-ribbon protein